MGQSIPSLKLPFSNIAGLPVEAQRQIRRNFEEVAKNLQPSSSNLFNAIIDPTLASSNAAAHQYKNLSDLLSSETWTLATTFCVAVIMRPGSTITETSTLSLPGNLSMMALGMGAPSAPTAYGGPASSRATWDLNGHQVTATNGTWISLYGMHIQSSAALTSSIPFATANVYMNNCLLLGQDPVSTGTLRINQVTSGLLITADSVFFDSQAQGVRTYHLNTDYAFFTGTSNLNIGQFGEVTWLGGSISAPFSGSTKTMQVTGANLVVLCFDSVGLQLGTQIAGFQMSGSISATGSTYLRYNGALGMNLTVSAAAGPVWVEGNSFSSLVQSGNTGQPRQYNMGIGGTGTTAVVDITGPCLARIESINNSGSSGVAKFRGSGIRADLHLLVTASGGGIQLIGCTDSFITVDLPPPTLGSQAWAIDAASARCILIASGVTNSNFSVASTNAGTKCRVITEGGDTLGTIGAPGGFIDFAADFMLLG